MMDALTGGVVVGAAAVGLWEMVFKHFLASKKAEEEAEEKTEEKTEESSSDGDAES